MHSARVTHSSGDLDELLLEQRLGERLAAQTAAADRTAADCKVQPGIAERRQNGLLDLIERQRPPADAMRQPLESAGGLADAALRVIGRAARRRVVVDDGPQDERVVGVQPERDLLVARRACRRRRWRAN